MVLKARVWAARLWSAKPAIGQAVPPGALLLAEQLLVGAAVLSTLEDGAEHVVAERAVAEQVPLVSVDRRAVVRAEEEA